MKIGETINYKGFTIKKVKIVKDKIEYLIKDIGLFFKTEKQAKKFIDDMGKDAITIKLDKVVDALNDYTRKGE
jgi:hypothetical protein